MQFALIVPALALAFLGVVSAFDTARAVRQATATAVTLSDLSTRIFDINDAGRDSLFMTGDALMSRWPASPATHSFSITSIINPVEADPSDPEVTEAVIWSETDVPGNELETSDLAAYNLPPIAEGESLILVEVKGVYAPKFAGMGLPTNIPVRRTSVRRPRFVSEVTYYDSAGNPITYEAPSSGGGGGGAGLFLPVSTSRAGPIWRYASSSSG
ncbi:MAG: hypothetical protein AAFW65_00770, partial [Pseudomonadota bacterium]